MRIEAKLFGLAALILIAFTACKPDDLNPGCTDPFALNHNPLAAEDDGSCTYLDSSFSIWNGTTGTWGPNPSTGNIEIIACQGVADTISIDSMPALYISKDMQGRFMFGTKIINKQDIRSFGNGSLEFDVMLNQGTSISQFNVFINGKQCLGTPGCMDICLSDPKAVTTANLSDTIFTTVRVPLLDFNDRFLQNADMLFSIRDNAPITDPDTLMFLRNIRWNSRP